MIHELGHFVFGKIIGYRLLSFRIGFLTWVYENDNIKFSFRRNKGTSGSCHMIQPKGILSLGKYALFIAGGVLFNLIIGTIFLLFIALNNSLSNNLELFLIYLVAVAFAFAFLNLIPHYSHNNATDGMILWSIIFKKPLQRIWYY